MELASSFIVLLLLTGGSDSGLQEIEENPSFNETDEEMTGRNVSWLQGLEENPSLNKTDEEKSEKETKHSGNCSFYAIYDYLKLTKNRDLHIIGRPVKNVHTITYIYLGMMITSVFDVREVDQTFISHIQVHLSWTNEHISWNPLMFCQIFNIKIPTTFLWKPDLTIEEMVEKDKATESPYLTINSYGFVDYYNDQIVVSTCKMRVYRFPFDVQRCTLSFRSIIYDDKELQLDFHTDNKAITTWSRRVMHTQYEWLFLELKVHKNIISNYIGSNQTTIIYTIYMKRKSVLYIANFIVPILFFLCLDLSSFLISDSGGEKLSFKVTVMLAITVMQLILNDILPSSSDKIPLIVVFCIGIFGLMMLSLLETILVMHLMEKDAASQNNEAIRDLNLNRSKQSCFKEVKKCANCASVSDDSTDSTDQTPSNTKEDSSSQLMDVSLALGKVSTELEEIEKTMTAISGEKKEKRSDYWTGVAKQINKVFVTFYITAAGVFLTVIFYLWGSSDEDH